MEWLPIKSAPKDGRNIIVGADIASVWITRNAFWSDDEFDENSEPGWWSYRNSVGRELLEGIYEPTHWIPMPYPPNGDV